MKPLNVHHLVTDAEWRATWAAIQARPDRARARRLVETAARVIQVHAAGRRPAVAWSGGKDSIALQVAASLAGVPRGVCVLSRLEWPAMENWIIENAPDTVRLHYRNGLNLAWLAANPGMLFPPDAKTAARWFRLTQHTGQRHYAREERIGTLIMGRRVQDGNYCGTVIDEQTRARAYTDRDGFTRLSPIAEWSHEDVMHVIATYAAPMPPIYDWPHGFVYGTGPWAAQRRRGDDHTANWSYVAEHAPGLLEDAARVGLPTARHYLAC